MFYKCWMLLVRARWFWGVRVGALRRPRWLHDVDLIRELTGQSVPYCKSTTQKIQFIVCPLIGHY